MNNVHNDTMVASRECGTRLTKIRKLLNDLAKHEDCWSTVHEFDKTAKRLDDVIRFLEIQIELTKNDVAMVE